MQIIDERQDPPEPGTARIAAMETTTTALRECSALPTSRIAWRWRRVNIGLRKALGEATGNDARALAQRLASALDLWRGSAVADDSRRAVAAEILGLPSGDVEVLVLSLLAHLNPGGLEWSSTCPVCKATQAARYDLGDAEVEGWAGGEPPGALYALREPLRVGPLTVSVLTLRPPTHGGLYASHKPGAPLNGARLLADAIVDAVVGTDAPGLGRLPLAAVDDLGDADAAALDRTLQAITLSARGNVETTCGKCGHVATAPIRAMKGVF